LALALKYHRTSLGLRGSGVLVDDFESTFAMDERICHPNDFRVSHFRTRGRDAIDRASRAHIDSSVASRHKFDRGDT
jgi:hypothetical protein